MAHNKTSKRGLRLTKTNAGNPIHENSADVGLKRQNQYDVVNLYNHNIISAGHYQLSLGV